nr:hypothetical protein GCM10020093_063880 [Planobispora longispora]
MARNPGRVEVRTPVGGVERAGWSAGELEGELQAVEGLGAGARAILREAADEVGDQ